MKKIGALFQKIAYKYLYEIRLQNKLLIAFFSMSLILLGISSIVIIWYISAFVEKQLLHSATETFNQTTTSIENTLFTYDQLSLGLARGNLFDELMKKDLKNYSIGQITSIRQNFERDIFASLRNYVNGTSYKVDLKIYFNDNFHYFNNRTRYYSLENFLNAPWCSVVIEQYAQNRGGFYILPECLLSQSPTEPPDSFSMVRVVMDKNYYPHILALMRMDISTDYLNEIITSTAFENTLTVVINQNNDVLASSDSTGNELLSTLISNYDLWNLSTGTWNNITLDNEKYLIQTVKIPEYSLLHFVVIPEKNLYSDLQNIRTFLVLTVIFMFFLCIPLASLVSRGLVFRLQSIVNTMQYVKEGRLSAFQEDIPHGNDEIGKLISSYNYMVEQMHMLMEQEYIHGVEVKNAELKALQAQINPHFLYNSLDMIYWFAKENMVEEIEKSVQDLALFYRIGLSNGREVITLREEITQAKAYMDIWNLRLQNSITYECIIAEDILDCLIIKTTLQPILENAVSHGIREKANPVGTIYVKAWLEHDDIIISIQDDGIGIAPETLDKLNQDTLIKESADHGYGIHNVQSRLKLYYGASYGLQFTSTYNQGTTVFIRIPKKITR